MPGRRTSLTRQYIARQNTQEGTPCQTRLFQTGSHCSGNRRASARSRRRRTSASPRQFLVKAADYYNVSCDYLLGHAANVLQLNRAVDFEDLPEDEEFSRETFIRADIAIMNNIVEDEEMADALNKAAALAGYMGLFAAVTKGLLPRSWLGINSDNKAQFKFLMYSIAGDIHDLTSAPEDEELIGTEAPKSVQSLCAYINDLINTRVARLM